MANSSPLNRLTAILSARCPRCRTGSAVYSFLRMRERCPVCDLDLCPESGYYLGAMMVAYLTTAILTIPVVIAMKLTREELGMEVLVWPCLQFMILAPLLLHYCRILWLHLEYNMSGRLDGRGNERTGGPSEESKGRDPLL